MTHKININNFSRSELTARLLTIQLNYSRKHSELIEAGKDQYLCYVKNIATENFIMPKDKIQLTVDHLALFLLGNKNNCFDKILSL